MSTFVAHRRLLLLSLLAVIVGLSLTTTSVQARPSAPVTVKEDHHIVARKVSNETGTESEDVSQKNNTGNWPYNPAQPHPSNPKIPPPRRHGEVPLIIAGSVVGAFFLLIVGFMILRYARRTRSSDVEAALLTQGPYDYNTAAFNPSYNASFSSSGQMVPIVPVPTEPNTSHSPGWGSYPHRVRHGHETETPHGPHGEVVYGPEDAAEVGLAEAGSGVVVHGSVEDVHREHL